MAFFCIKSGVRIVAPGVAISAGGNVQEYVEPETSAESATAAGLSELAKHEAETSAPEQDAAVEETSKPRPEKARGK
jgi:hypothetical protein